LKAPSSIISASLSPNPPPAHPSRRRAAAHRAARPQPRTLLFRRAGLLHIPVL